MNKKQLPENFCIKVIDREEGADLIEKLEQLYNLQTNWSGSSLDYYYGIQNDQIRRYGESFGTEYTYSEFQELITSPKELTELPEKWFINWNISEEDKDWFKAKYVELHNYCPMLEYAKYYIMSNNFKWVYSDNFKPDYPELTILQLKQYFNKMEKKQEKWVECVDNDKNAKNLTIGKKYKIEGESYEYYYITNNSGIKSAGGYLKRRFKEINMEKEGIIGYKAPYNMFNGDVKKDHLFIKVPGDSGYYPEEHSTLYKNLPREIVEKWEPVYKTKETILQIGSPSKKVSISKGKIEVEGSRISIYSLNQITSSNKAQVGSWTVKDIRFQIGCSWFELNEIQKVIDAYNEFLK